MKGSNIVVIKSFQNGIALHLDPEVSFGALLDEVGLKFKESGPFFKDARMALSFEDRALSMDEEKELLDAIHENCDLNIICIIGKDEETNQNYFKALQQFGINSGGDSGEGQFYRGTLKNGQILETESSIVILGDVYPGSEIISAKDIIILGGLYGEAYAGGNGETGHYVVALEMSPEKLRIGDFKYNNRERVSKWSIKPKVQPKIAYIKDEKVVLEPITKELLSSLPV